MGSRYYSPDRGADRLFVVDRSCGGSRRMHPDEFRDTLRRAGVELVRGVARFTGVSDASCYRGGLPIHSQFHVFEAQVLTLDGGDLEWISDPLPDSPQRTVVLMFALAMGNGAPFPQPSGRFDLSVEGETLVPLCLTKRSRWWAGRDARCYYDVQRVQTATFGDSFDVDENIRNDNTFVDGLVFLTVPERLCRPGRPLRVRIDAVSSAPSKNWLRVGLTNPVSLADVVAPGIDRALEGPRPERYGEQLVLFGDLHNHSGDSALIDGQPEGVGAGESCGEGTRESLFQHARDVAGLDFFCLSEHDWQLSHGDWRQLAGLAEEFNSADGSFITMHGFEWTSANYGHRNVYFRGEPGPLVYSADPDLPQNTIADGLPTPNDLWRALRESGVTAITVPHHMSAKQFPLSLEHFFDADFDRVAEIYSSWGDSLEHGQPVSAYTARVAELAFIHSVRAGYRVGFIASSDSHDGHPGTAQGTGRRSHLYHHLGSGLAGVLVDRAERGAVFDAIAARRCFAATGERLLACTELNGHPMGAVVQGSKLPARPSLRVTASSFLPVDEVLVYRNGEVVERVDVDAGTEVDLDWHDPDYQRGDRVSYFAKVLRSDGEQAWTSPIWITD